MGEKYHWEIHHLRRLLAPACTVLDVGANYGYCAVVLAAGLKKQCRILAIEPEPENFARLTKHVQWNGISDVVQCHEVGVSDTPGIAAMAKPAGNTGHARISNRECRMTNVEGDSSFDIRHSTFITLTTLDDFCSARGLERLDAILLDVEGFEDRALKGAAKTLDRFRPLVVVELWPPAMQQQGTSVEAVADVLEKHDYRLFRAASAAIAAAGGIAPRRFGRLCILLP